MDVCRGVRAGADVSVDGVTRVARAAVEPGRASVAGGSDARAGAGEVPCGRGSNYVYGARQRKPAGRFLSALPAHRPPVVCVAGAHS